MAKWIFRSIVLFFLGLPFLSIFEGNHASPSDYSFRLASPFVRAFSQEQSGTDLTLTGLAPTEVIQGEPVGFSLMLTNPLTQTVQIQPETSLSFSDGVYTYTASLLDAPISIDPGVVKQITFSLEPVLSEFAASTYQPVVEIHALDFSGQPFTDTQIFVDSFAVRSNMPGLSEVPGTLMPTDPDSYFFHMYNLSLENSAGCPIQLDETSRITIDDGQRVVFTDPLDMNHTEIILPSKQNRIIFQEKSILAIPDGEYLPRLHLSGSRICDGLAFSAYIPLTQSTEISLATSGNAGRTRINYTPMLYRFNQFGGKIYSSTTNETSSRQGMAIVNAEPYEPGPVTAEMLKTEPFPLYANYLQNVPIITRFFPTDDIPREQAVRISQSIMWQTNCGGSFCAGVSILYQPFIIIQQKEGKAGINSLEPKNTFVQVGQPPIAVIDIKNPDTNHPLSGQSGALTHTLLESSKVIISQQGQDRTDNFQTEVVEAGLVIPQGYTNIIHLVANPQDVLPEGWYDMDADVVTSAVYTGADDDYHVITGTVRASEYITTQQFLYIDPIPLTPPPHSLIDPTILIGTHWYTYTIQVDNNSNFSFNLDPVSSLTITYTPTQYQDPETAIYRGTITNASPHVIDPQTSVTLTFTSTRTTRTGQEGIYIPDLLLKGAFTDGNQTWPFHQHLDMSQNRVWIDPSPPEAWINITCPQVQIIPRWGGRDGITGISFDVQYMANGGEWTNWLENTQLTQQEFQPEVGTSYRFRVRAKDWAGNYSNWMETQDCLALQPPEAWFVHLPQYTAIPDPWLSWGGVAGGGLNHYDLQYRDGDGPWIDWLSDFRNNNYQFYGENYHIYTLRVRVVDGLGNEGRWTEGSMTIDSISPTIWFEPIESWTNNPAIELAWDGTDSFTGIDHFAVGVGQGDYWWENWTVWLPNTTSKTATFTGIDGKTYHFRFASFDKAGNGSGWSEVSSIGVDATSPSASISNLSSSQSTLTFPVTWAGSDNYSGIHHYQLQVQTGEGDWADWLPETTAILANFAGEQDQMYSFRVRAFDVAGNVGDWSSPKTTVISSPPSIAALAAWQANLTIPLSWTWNNTYLTVDHYGVQVQVDGGAWSDWIASTFDTSAGFTGENAHCYGFRVKAFATNGYATDWSPVQSTCLDTTLPVSAIGAAVELQNSSMIDVGWSGSDTGSGVNGYQVQVRAGAESWIDWLGQTQLTHAEYSGIPGSTYRFRVRAIDRAGNVSNWSESGDCLALEPPRAFFVILPRYSSSPGLWISWGSVTQAGLAYYDLQYKVDDGDWRNWLSGFGNNNYYFAATVGHQYTLRVKVTDTLGYYSAWTEGFLTIDAQAPTSWINPLPEWVTNPSIPVSWDGTDDISGIDHYSVYMSAGSLNWTLWQNTTSKTEIFSGVDGETYHFKVEAYDKAGNRSAQSGVRTVSVDTSLPIAAISQLTEYQVDPSFSVQWTGSDSFSGINHFQVQSQTDGGDWADWLTDTTVYLADFTGVEGHSYNFRVRALDNAGNIGEWSAIAHTRISPPVTMQALSPWQNTLSIQLSWSWDNVIGADYFIVQIQTDMEDWTDWLQNITETSANFFGEDGHCYQFRVQAVDIYGLMTGWSSTQSTCVDRTPPVSTVDDLAEWQNNSEINLAWNGSDNGSGLDRYQVQVQGNGGTWEDWLVNTDLLSDIFTGEDGRTYSFRVRAVDIAGNLGVWSPSVSTSLDLTAPTTELVAQPEWRTNAAIPVSWSGADTGSGVANYEVQVQTNGGDWINWLTASTLTSSEFTGADARHYAFRVRASDLAGNSSDWSTTAETSIDLTAPTASLSSQPEWHMTSTIPISWNGFDTGSGAAAFDLQVKIDTGEWINLLVGASATSADYQGEDGRAYSFRVRAIDVAGNTGGWSEDVSTRLDLVAPSSTLDQQPEWLNTAVIPVSWSGNDGGSGISMYDVQVQTDGGGWSDWLANSTLTSANFTGADGRIYAFRARAIDVAGNTSSWSEAVTTSLDLTAPSASLASQPEWRTHSAIPVSWSGSDAGSGVVSYEVQVQTDGSSWSEWLAGSTLTSADFTGLDGHAYTFRVRALDAAGNFGSWSEPVITTIDMTSPSILLDSQPEWRTSASIPVSWDGSDVGSGIKTYDIQVQVDGGEWTDWLSASSLTSAVFTGADAHSYGFRVRASDLAGNLSDWSTPVETSIDLSAPTSILSSQPEWRKTSTIPVSWNGYDTGSGVASFDLQLQIDTEEWVDLLTGTSAISMDYLGEDGHAYTFRVRAKDVAGNIGEWSEVISTSLDLTAPSAQFVPQPEWRTTVTVPVSWNASDTGSGVANYDVQVQTDGGEWAAWLTSTTLTSADYIGTDSHTYAFRIRALDVAGNFGEWSTSNITHIDVTGPLAMIQPLPQKSPNQFFVNWTGSDANSGVDYFEVQVQMDGGEWHSWLSQTDMEAAEYTGQSGRTYTFRVRAVDKAGNLGEWSEFVSTQVNLINVYLPLTIR